MTETPTTTRHDPLRAWLATPLGRALIEHESELLEEALDGVFGDHCLQVGLWGEPRQFLRFARTQRTVSIGYIVDDTVGDTVSDTFSDTVGDTASADGAPSAIGHPYRLPILSDSIDAAILPHTLEFSNRPHAILREVHRVLRADGHLIVLGFKPGGLWGLRRLVPGAAMPPGVDQLVADRQLCDWLQLLDLHIHGVTRYFFRWPLPGNRTVASRVWEDRGRRFWPELGACYMLSAQKRVVALTPVKKPWRSRRKVVGGLVKPTTRVIHVHFGKNS